jgi:hypothetical protein
MDEGGRFCKDPVPDSEWTHEMKVEERKFKDMLVNMADEQRDKCHWSPVSGYLWVYILREERWAESSLRHPGADYCPVCTRRPNRVEKRCEEAIGLHR